MLTRPSRDGWTPEVQQRFLRELACTASPAQAALAAGRSLQSAYKLRKRPGATAFRDGWAEAITTCMLQIREQAIDRAFNGHVEPIIRHGRKVGERQVSNNAMLLSLMRLYDAPAYHADRARAAPAVVPQAAVPLTKAELSAQFKAGMAELARKESPQAAKNVQDILLQIVALGSPSKAAVRA